MGAGEDFNPGFSFDVGEAEGPAQTPWEFGGALKMALQDHRGSTTIDDKINKRLQERQHKNGKQQQQQQQQNGKPPQGKQSQQQQKAAAGSRKRQRQAEPEDSEDSDSAESESESDAEDAGAAAGGSSDEAESEDYEDGSSDDEDQPLPGELDAEDSSEDGLEDGGESSEGEEEQQPARTVKGKQQQQQQNGRQKPGSAAAAAAARAAAMANGNGAGRHSSSEDGASDSEAAGSDEEEQPAAAGKQRQRQKQQQQQQQEAKQQQGRKAGGKAGFYAETQRGFKQDERTFQDLNLSRPLLRAVAALGYTQPTPIQAACIPLALAGRDICGSAVTGSGKTAAFTLPILERLLYRPRQVAATYVLILSPTRELAAQIHSMIQKLAQFTDIDAALIVGGLSLQAQAAALRGGPAIVVATPGRIIDHVRNSQGFGLEDLAVLVLDEADRLLEMGFKEELRELLRLAPRNRQTMLFSATFNDDVQQLAALSLKSPVRMAADPTAAAPETLSQEVVRLKGSAGNSKEAVLLGLASRSFSGGKTIIFCETKQRAHRLKILFGLCELPPAAELHGDLTQAARLQSLEKFRKGEVAFLLATDVAARGLDILGLQVVLNYDAPRNLETYLHRVGRTARAGSEGLAVSLVTDDDRGLLKAVVKTGRVTLKQRVVPHQAVARWQAKLEAVEPDVQRVMAEEREETALRKAEMEANKAQNLLDHESTIFSRPARTWFQTEKEKKAAAAAAAAAAAQGKTALEMEAAAAAGGSKAAKAAAKAAAKQDKRNAKLKEQRAAEAAAPKKRSNELQTETEQFNKAIKGVKSRARALMQQGMTAKVAQKMAQKAVTGVSMSHQKKKRKTSGSTAAAAGGDGDAAGEGGLFSGDGTGKGAPGSGGAAGGGKGRGSSSGGGSSRAKSNLSKTDLNRIKRGGKGKSSFKSKKKFKRR